MMKNIKQKKQWFSIVVAIFMIGFLLVLTTGVFNLVLREMKWNKWAESYLKAYAGAEWAMELWLLKIKENGYWFDEDLEFTDSGSEILSFETDYKKNRDPRISYDMDIKTNKYSASWSLSLATGATVIIPLFWKDWASEWITTKLNLLWLSSEADMNWNIIGKHGEWISWTGSFNYTITKKYQDKNGAFVTNTIKTFLTDNPQSYLMLFNKNPNNNLDYIVDVDGADFFSKPIGLITSSVIVGGYKHNISTEINNTKFLNMLKYSVYSN